jgi:hypothetical protein
MYKLLLLLGFLFSIILFGALFALFIPIHLLNPHAKEADRILKSESPYLALEQYDIAQTEMPFLEYNFLFQEQKKQAMRAIEQYKVKTPALIIFLADETDIGLINDFVYDLQSTDGILAAKFISFEDSAHSYIEQNKPPKLLNLDQKILLSSQIEVYLKDWDKAELIKSDIKAQPFVTEVVLLDKPF